MSKAHRLQRDAGACVGCGLCREDSSACNIAIVDGRARVVAQDGIMCGHCVAICPTAAVSMPGGLIKSGLPAFSRLPAQSPLPLAAFFLPSAMLKWCGRV